MNLILRLFATAVLMLGTCSVSNAMSKGWESTRIEQWNTAKSVMRDLDLEVKASSGSIVVQSNHPVQIKIFTILGRLVTSETVPSGAFRFTFPVHGVYIVKIGDMTCKVAV